MQNIVVVTAIVDAANAKQACDAITPHAIAVYAANTPVAAKNSVDTAEVHNTPIGKAVETTSKPTTIADLVDMVEKIGVDATAQIIAGSGYHTCVFKSVDGKETPYLSGIGKPNKLLTLDAVNAILAQGVHKVVFTKKDGTITECLATKDWVWCKDNAEKIGYKEPKGTDGGKHAAQDAAKNLVTFYKVGISAQDSGYRRFALDKLVSID